MTPTAVYIYSTRKRLIMQKTGAKAPSSILQQMTKKIRQYCQMNSRGEIQNISSNFKIQLFARLINVYFTLWSHLQGALSEMKANG